MDQAILPMSLDVSIFVQKNFFGGNWDFWGGSSSPPPQEA